MIKCLARNIGRSSHEDLVKTFTKDRIGYIYLNRPKKLNAMNHSMVQMIRDTALKYDQSDEISLICISSTSDNFSSGGDVRSLCLDGSKLITKIPTDKHLQENHRFLCDVYENFIQMRSLKTPTISLIDGLCFGGGMGFAIHSTVSIATKRSKFAMPEVSIGFFPDVGMVKMFSDVIDKVGYYFALTGVPFSSTDAYSMSLISYLVDDSSDFTRLLTTLSTIARKKDSKFNYSELIRILGLQSYSKSKNEPFSSSIIDSHRLSIHEMFKKSNCVEDLVRYLSHNSTINRNDSFWTLTHDSLLKCCPASVAVSYEFLKRAHSLTIIDCLNLEKLLALKFLSRTDFYEGVASKLIRKDNNPTWNPNSFEFMTKRDIDSFFI